jgi:hypothetical protein
MREKNSDIFEEIARNTRNISKSLYVLAQLNILNYQNEYEVDIIKDDNLRYLRTILWTIKDEILK